MRSQEELNEALDGLMIIIQAAARTMLSSSSLSPLESSPERTHIRWESHLRKILDEYPPDPRPDENALLATIQEAWILAENLRGQSSGRL